MTVSMYFGVFTCDLMSLNFKLFDVDVFIFISPEEYIASEDDGFATVTLIKEGEIDTEVGVTLVTFDGSAKGILHISNLTAFSQTALFELF